MHAYATIPAPCIGLMIGLGYSDSVLYPAVLGQSLSSALPFTGCFPSGSSASLGTPILTSGTAGLSFLLFFFKSILSIWYFFFPWKNDLIKPYTPPPHTPTHPPSLLGPDWSSSAGWVSSLLAEGNGSGPVPRQGAWVGCGLGPSWGAGERQLISVSHSLFFPPLCSL